MKYIFLLFIIIAILCFGVYGYGTNLPATHKFNKTAIYDKPIELIWQAIADYEIQPQWSENTVSSELLESIDTQHGDDIWRFVYADGNFMDIKITQSQPPFLHISKIINTDYPFTGSWKFELAKIDDNKTKLVLTEEGTVENPLWRLIFKHIIGQEIGAESYLQELGDNLEVIEKLTNEKNALEAEQNSENANEGEENSETENKLEDK